MWSKALLTLKRFILLASLILHSTSQALVLEAGILPGLAIRGQALGVLRVNSRILIGSEFFKLGPFGDFQSLAPQVIDTSYGAALRIGQDSYFELQGGYFQRRFSQEGTTDLDGKGFIVNMIYGLHLSPHLGIDVVLSGKRISSGTLDKRTIIDLIPLFTMRSDF